MEKVSDAAPSLWCGDAETDRGRFPEPITGSRIGLPRSSASANQNTASDINRVYPKLANHVVIVMTGREDYSGYKRQPRPSCFGKIHGRGEGMFMKVIGDFVINRIRHIYGNRAPAVCER